MRDDPKKHKQWQDTYRSKHPERVKEIANRYRLLRYEKYRKLLKSLGVNGCKNCENEHGFQLHYHHTDVEDKDFEVGYFIMTHGYNDKNINLLCKELEKCIPLCVTCHTKLHNQER